MAGFVFHNREEGGAFQFHIGDKDLPAKIIEASGHPRVIRVQLDGDELDAFFWGLENYRKGSESPLNQALRKRGAIKDG